MAIFTTLLSLRLLGIRRGWGTALLAALIGWGLAMLIAVGLNGWDWDADEMVVHLLAIGIPASMAAAVTLDLLARPGSLARGERAGLVVAPTPLRAVKRRLSVLRRYRELVRLCRQEGFGPFLSEQRASRSARIDAPGVRIRRVLEQAGGVYIKLGQIAATRVDLLPRDICDELAELQNRVKSEPKERIAPVLEAELGAPVEQVFAEFDWEPLAAASIGQTYTARLHSGEAVVVKVQRPDIEALMERDLAALALLADLAQRRTPFGQGIRSGEMLAQFAARAAGRARLPPRGRRHVRDGDDAARAVHRPRPEGVSRRVGATGARAGALRGVHRLRHPPSRRRRRGSSRRSPTNCLRATLDQVMRIGLFHADPHPGNVFALPDGTLGLIDFGAVGRLDPIQQAAIVDLMLALARRDVSLLRDAVERVADLADTTSPEQLERALARLMAEHVRPGGTVDPAVLQDLVATLSRFGMRLPTDVVLLSRALVTVDGTLRALRPDISLVAAATELVDRGAEPVVDPKELARDELLAMVPHLRRLPERVDRILALTGRGELRVRSIVDEDSRRIVRTLANRLLLVLAGTSFLFTSAWLLVAADDGPRVSGSTGLFDVFGYGGLLLGVVLVLRVVAAVARDGTT